MAGRLFRPRRVLLVASPEDTRAALPVVRIEERRVAITMQGAWNVSVKSKNATFPHRFIIAGASSGNGTYVGDTTTSPVAVSGVQWSLSVQHDPAGATSWTALAMRIGTPVAVAGQIRVDIRSNDTGPDEDYDDLVLTCSMTSGPSEYVVYGNVETYSGRCLFNHCGLLAPWIVIDSPIHLQELLLQPTMRSVLEELYPDRIRRFADRRGVVRPPNVGPDAPPFVPLMIPLRSNVAADFDPHSAQQDDAKAGRSSGSLNLESVRMSARLPIFSAASTKVAAHARNLGKLIDIYRFGCTVKDAPGILLRFLEYDRTVDELLGGPYSGAGARLPLGLTATDEVGNYIFRFTQTLEELATEVSDQVEGGPTLATQLRPDLIAQVISPGPAAVLYESALHPDVPNLRRIDLCIPEHVLNPGPTSCQGGRSIQAIGNIFTIAGVGNT